MRSFLSLLLIFSGLQSLPARTFVAAKTIQQSSNSALTNADVLALLKEGLSPDVIVAKLQRSRCACDTSAEELQRLKSAGVPDQILVAMITTKTASSEVIALKIPAETVIEIETAYRISSQEIKAGEAISFHVVRPVKIGDVIVIDVGAVATGRVLKSSRGGHFGKAGRLAWTMESVTAVDGSQIPIKASGRIVGDSKGAKVATKMVITGVLLGPFAPAALLFGFKRGKNAYIAQGRRYEVTVTTETMVQAKSGR